MTRPNLGFLAKSVSLSAIISLAAVSVGHGQSAGESRKQMMEILKASNPAAYEQMKRAEEQRAIIEEAQNDPSKRSALMTGPEPEYPELAPVVYRDQMPRPVWSSILDRITFEPDGKYGWEGLTFAFLPEVDQNGKKIVWEKRNSIQNDQDRLHMEIYHQGKLIADHWMRGTASSRLTHAVHVNKASRFTKGIELTHNRNKLEPGEYEFVFKIADDELYRLETEVVSVQNPDRYADLSEILVLEGLHDQYLGLSFADAKSEPFKPRDSSQPITWHLGFRNPVIDTRAIEKRLFGRLYFQNMEVATMEGLLIAEHGWKMLSGNFDRWDSPSDIMSSRKVRAGDLTLRDMKNGEYTLLVHILEKGDRDSDNLTPSDSDLIEYKFQWKDGRFVLPDHMDDRKTDANEMIEGLGHTIWIEAENGPHPWLLDEEGNQPKATKTASAQFNISQSKNAQRSQSGSYTNLEDPAFVRVKTLLEKVSRGEMSFEETGLPEPSEADKNGGPGYTYYTRVKEAKLDYARHEKRREREASYKADAERREEDAAAITQEREKALAGAADYAAQAEADAAKARAEAEKMMEEMRKKYE